MKFFAATLLLLVALVVSVLHAVVQPFLSAAPSGSDSWASPERLRTTVEKLCSIAPRDHAHPQVLTQVARYIQSELEAAGLKVEATTYEVDGKPYENLVARVGNGTGEAVVVGAHYDVEGERPGADDNASGVAGLLELGRHLVTHPPHGPVELVAYTLEEPPHFRKDSMGSVHHAKALRAEGRSIRAMLSLEMIGYFSDEPESQGFPLAPLRWIYPTTGNFIALVGKIGHGPVVKTAKRGFASATLLPVWSINAPTAIRGIDWSDHRSYWNEGYEALMVTDTSFLRNDRYHTMRDLPETLDYRRMALVVEGVDGAVRALLAE